jgi:putative phosphoesterase
MKIGILSDTHDEVERTSRAVAALVGAGAEALVHCGDLTVPEVVLECGGLPSYFVFGNNDFDRDGLLRAMALVGGRSLGRGGEVVLDGRRIAVTHGDSAGEMRRLLAADPDYFLFGHSHRTADERRGATRWINPGALYRANPWTVALLDLQVDFLEFLTIDGRP